MADDFDHCADIVRQSDPDRYASALFAPAAARAGLFALYAFNVEIARVREAVSGPMPGEIRLQWWRDALVGQAHGEATAHPVLAALLTTLTLHRLPVQPFLDLIDARVFDLYDDPMPSVPDLEGYAGETSSALMRLAAIILTGNADAATAEAAGHGGVAYAVTGLLRALPVHARRGQCFLPLDLLEAQGLGRADAVSGVPAPGIEAVRQDMLALARRHYAAALAALKTVPAEAMPAFLPLALVPGDLARLGRLTGNPFEQIVETPRWRRLWTLWRTARRTGKRGGAAFGG